jgi:hypothetical protein
MVVVFSLSCEKNKIVSSLKIDHEINHLESFSQNGRNLNGFVPEI